MEPSEVYMSLLRLAAYSTLFGYVLVQSAYTQATHPATNQNPTALSTAQTHGALEPFTLAPANPPRFQFPARKPSGDFNLLVQLPRYQKTPPQGEFDRGIYLRKGGGGCISIISYNFSPGENPQLENVTTCTPANITKALRARGKDKKPVAPLFQTTDLKTVSPE